MKRTLVALLVGIALTPALMAGPLQVTTIGGAGYGPFQTGTGGEFTFSPSANFLWVLNKGYVDGVTKNLPGLPNTFQTFCVEEAEFVYPNTTFDVTISNKSIFTNVSLTLGAAWLYHQFQTGQLANYDYTNRPAAQIQALQTAIWYFMGVAPDPGAGNVFRNLGIANGGFALNTTIPVAVLNLWAPGQVGTTAGARQDMLVCVPDGGLTLMLLGIGVGSLALISRRLRA
ncbi:MAG: hypothetical protein LAP85_22265 [Acidobacteriia bacterium]|nr:hypothetical protein [Terriglobia bacterium]